MLDRTDRIDFLQHAVETLAEQMLQLHGELASLRTEVEASEQRQLHLMARADQMEAIQVSLSALEHQLSASRKPRPMVNGEIDPRQAKRSGRWLVLRRFALVILSATSLLIGLALALRTLLIQREPQPPLIRETATRKAAALSPSLLLTLQGPSWLEVQTSDGKRLHYALAKPGTYRFPVLKAVRIRAGRPDLVIVSFDGSTAVLGAIDALGWRTYKPG
jgi:hypothetical protein